MYRLPFELTDSAKLLHFTILGGPQTPLPPPQMTPLLQELHWLPVEQRITYKLAVLTYKTRQTSVPKYLSRHIATRSSMRSLRSCPRHCCMSHSDELPLANALSALQHHLSGTLSLSLFRTVTRSRYLNLDLKHICSPPSMLLNCPVRQHL